MIEPGKREVRFLLISIFLIAVCAITYELLIGALSSYLLGNSVTQFSITIGLFLTFMGVGSWTSRYIKKRLLSAFLNIEMLLGILGGFSLAILYFAYTYTEIYSLVFVLLTAAIGILIGLEIPLITRIIKNYDSIRVTLSNVLSVDYLGGLVASLIFPFILLPYFGLIKTAFLTGIINVAVVIIAQAVFRKKAYSLRRMAVSVLAVIILAAGFIFALRLSILFEKELYRDTIVYARQTPFQKIVITRRRDDLRLYLDGNLQFSTIDEFRYHESLVHPAVLSAAHVENVLVLGGGDGMAIRELLRYPGIKRIVLVDIDKAITDLGLKYKPLAVLNKYALKNKKVQVINTDAFKYLEKRGSLLFDIIIADFPDPNNHTLCKLYSREFFTLVKKRLSRGGAVCDPVFIPLFRKAGFLADKQNTAQRFSTRTSLPRLSAGPGVF